MDVHQQRQADSLGLLKMSVTCFRQYICLLLGDAFTAGHCSYCLWPRAIWPRQKGFKSILVYYGHVPQELEVLWKGG